MYGSALLPGKELALLARIFFVCDGEVTITVIIALPVVGCGVSGVSLTRCTEQGRGWHSF